MKFKASFSHHAKEDKIEIKNYLSQFYPTSPRRFTTTLKKYVSILKENPYMYPVYPEKPDYRRMVVDNYIVLYKISEQAKEIEIFRILRASWDIPKYL